MIVVGATEAAAATETAAAGWAMVVVVVVVVVRVRVRAVAEWWRAWVVAGKCSHCMTVPAGELPCL